MVLTDLGVRITDALKSMTNATVIDKQVVDTLLKEVGNALIGADVNVSLVLKMRKNIATRIQSDDVAAGMNKRKLIQRAVYDELCNLLDPGVEPYKLCKGKPNVIMFVGLQGSGKTTTVTKMAHYYKRKGWKPALICADTFRAGAYDQLKQNATRAGVPFYGSYIESNPVQVARDGVNRMKAEGRDVIIVDTSGRHKQEAALFEEMQQVAAAVQPDEIVFVMDGTIGQAAQDQAEAFKASVDVGACIITKLDGNAKGGGALSAVAATKSPIIFYGVGEHLHDLDEFQPGPFVQKLLGMGDMRGLAEMMKSVVPDMKGQEEMMRNLQEGRFTLRNMYEQFQTVDKMGPINKVMEKLPGMAQLMSQGLMKGADGNAKLRTMMVMMDSMTDQELDEPKLLLDKKNRDTRVERIARGSGHTVAQVVELLDQYKMISSKMSKMGKLKMGRGGQLNQRNLAQVAQMVPQGMLNQMGGMSGIKNMMKSMGSAFGQ